MSDLTAVRARVTGRVQGVYYRQSTRQSARRLNLIGWVRNLVDGRVEVFAQGERGNVEALLEWLWMGPPGAIITGVESDEVSLDLNLQDFLVVE